MAKCSICDGPEHPTWKAHTFAPRKQGAVKAKLVSPPRVSATRLPTKALVSNKPMVRSKTVGFDRNAYQREYMRKRRAKARRTGGR